MGYFWETLLESSAIFESVIMFLAVWNRKFHFFFTEVFTEHLRPIAAVGQNTLLIGFLLTIFIASYYHVTLLVRTLSVSLSLFV